MTGVVNDELLDAEAAVAACRRAIARAAVLQRELAAEQETCQALRRKVSDERADVRKLKGVSFKSITSRLRGRRDDLAMSERAEVAAAEAELATHQSAMKRLSAQFAAAQQEAQQLGAAEERLAAAVEQREREVAAGGDEHAERLLELDHELGDARARRDEVRSAHDAALHAVGALEYAAERLSGAEGWSVVDVLSEGRGGARHGSTRFFGDVAGRAKQDHLDESVVPVAEAHASLLKLRAELTDVGGGSVHKPNIRMPSSGLSRMDIWFDNRFSDLMVHDRISSSISELEKAAASVKELIGELEPRDQVASDRVDQLESERDALLRRS